MKQTKKKDWFISDPTFLDIIIELLYLSKEVAMELKILVSFL